jgi:predicted HicB family RNase H-like nuclease
MSSRLSFRVVIDTNVLFEGLTKQGSAASYDTCRISDSISIRKKLSMSRLTLRLPETLHQQLVKLAEGEGVSLNQ